MRIVIDTHIILQLSLQTLSSQSRMQLLQNKSNQIYISGISLWEISKLLNRSGQLWQILLDQNVKYSLCQYVYKTNEWPLKPESLEYRTLQNMAHANGHRNHFHVIYPFFSYIEHSCV